MTNSDTHTHDNQVECKVCLKEIPQTEAQAEEVHDYVAYFCGLDCYEKWKKLEEKTDQ